MLFGCFVFFGRVIYFCRIVFLGMNKYFAVQVWDTEKMGSDEILLSSI